MSFEQLLATLQPAHTPPPPAWWPPAIGYWIIAALVCGLAATLALRSRRRRRQRWFELAGAELQSIARQHRASGDATELASGLSRWLRKVAVLAFPDPPLAGLTGERWLEFLDASMQDRRFSAGPGRVFAHDAYRRTVEVDAKALLNLCNDWLGAVQSQLKQADKDSRRAVAPKRTG